MELIARYVKKHIDKNGKDFLVISTQNLLRLYHKGYNSFKIYKTIPKNNVLYIEELVENTGIGTAQDKFMSGIFIGVLEYLYNIKYIDKSLYEDTDDDVKEGLGIAASTKEAFESYRDKVEHVVIEETGEKVNVVDIVTVIQALHAGVLEEDLIKDMCNNEIYIKSTLETSFVAGYRRLLSTQIIAMARYFIDLKLIDKSIFKKGV